MNQRSTSRARADIDTGRAVHILRGGGTGRPVVLLAVGSLVPFELYELVIRSTV
jgi:hypothetical protein